MYYKSYSNPIITNYRYSADGDRISNKIENEKHLISNSCVPLNELPDIQMGVIVKANENALTEIRNEEEEITEDKFFVDYINGFIYFNKKLNGTQVEISYNGMGVTFFPASRVWLNVDNQNQVIKTLSDIEDDIKEHTKTTNSFKDLIQSSLNLKNELSKEKNKAENTSKELKSALDNANSAIKELSNSPIAQNLKDAKEINTTLESNIAKADSANNKTNQAINEINSLKDTIDKQNKLLKDNMADATKTQTDLGKILDNTKTEKQALSGLLGDAKSAQSTLDKGINKATNSKGELENLVNKTDNILINLGTENKKATENISNLSKKIDTCKATTSELNTSIANASNTNTTLTATDEEAKKTEALIIDLMNQLGKTENEVKQIIASGDLSKYITDPKLQEVLKDYATKDDLSKIDITSQLTDYAKKTEVPTKLSQLTNDTTFKTETEIQSMINAGTPDLTGYVEKVQGKGLSTNDYTDSAKAKVDAIPNNPKYTDTIPDLTPYAKKENIPTKISQIENDKTFKTEAEIQSMINNASKLKKEVVTSLPSSGKDDVIYLVKDPKGKDNNNYLEYLWLNGKYELIGSTQVDLTGYAKLSDIDTNTNILHKDRDQATASDVANKTGAGKYVDGNLLSEITTDVKASILTWISTNMEVPDIQEFTQQELEEAFK